MNLLRRACSSLRGSGIMASTVSAASPNPATQAAGPTPVRHGRRAQRRATECRCRLQMGEVGLLHDHRARALIEKHVPPLAQRVTGGYEITDRGPQPGGTALVPQQPGL